jgi:hypothetical protein
MCHFFDKRVTVVDVNDKEVINCFQDGFYHRCTYKGFGRRFPSSIIKIKDMIISWDNEDNKANTKYDSNRGKGKNNMGSKNNKNQGSRQNNNNNYYSGPKRKRKPYNTIVAIQCSAKDNSKKTSDGFKELLKEECPWHPENNHTTEKCYRLRRALKDTPEPRHPHDKNGKGKVNKGNGDFQDHKKIVNVLFRGYPTKRA